MLYLWNATVRGVIFMIWAISFIVRPQPAVATLRATGAQLAGRTRRPRIAEEGPNEALRGQRRHVGRPSKTSWIAMSSSEAAEILREVSGCTDTECLGGEIGILADRQKDQLDLGHEAFELSAGVQPVQQGH